MVDALDRQAQLKQLGDAMQAAAARADWTRLDYRDDGGEADAYSVSYIRRF